MTTTEVQLVHRSTDQVAMSWRIADLLTHWSKKHEAAAYVRRTGSVRRGYTYGPYVQIGEGADWQRFRQAIENGTIAVDPAYSWIENRATWRKARSQLRCYPYELGSLYQLVTVHDLRHATPSRRLAEINLKAERIVLPSWLQAP